MFINDLAKVLKTDKTIGDKSFYAKVMSIIYDDNGDRIGYKVSLGDNNDTMDCICLAGAEDGDIVLVTLLSNGKAICTGRKDGDKDAIDAKETAEDVERRADAGEFDGEDGVTLYGTCETAGDNPNKEVYLTNSTMEELRSGITLSVSFKHANTANNPKLNIYLSTDEWSGLKDIMTNGQLSAYWTGGDMAVLFTYDGDYWQCCSAAVYASEVTIGNPADKHLYIDEDAVSIQSGTDEYAKFSRSLLQLGKNSAQTYIEMGDGIKTGLPTFVIQGGNTILGQRGSTLDTQGESIIKSRIGRNIDNPPTTELIIDCEKGISIRTFNGGSKDIYVKSLDEPIGTIKTISGSSEMFNIDTDGGIYEEIANIELSAGLWIINYRIRFSPSNSGNHYIRTGLGESAASQLYTDTRFGTGTLALESNVTQTVYPTETKRYYIIGYAGVAGTWLMQNSNQMRIQATRLL